MKAAAMERYGSPDVLQLRDVPKPVPKADEVLVRVHAASVNDWDWGLLQGAPFTRMLYGLVKPKVRIIGGDFAGRVEAVGENVKAFRPGDEVYGDLCMSGFGAFAEYVCAPEASLARKPAAMTFVQAAAIPQAGMLAVQGLIDAGGIRSGQKLLLNGAGGGVGTFALQIAKLYDVEVTAVDKPAKLDMLRSLGADHVIDFLKEDFTKGGKRYDLILDVKTNRSPFAYARALNPGGAYVTVGGSLPRLFQTWALGPLISRLFKKHVRFVALKPNKDLDYMNELFEAGKMAPVIEGVYLLADLPKAFRLFGAGDHKGKIIVSMAKEGTILVDGLKVRRIKKVHSYTTQLSSDVVRDGLAVELLDEDANVVAEVLRCDRDHTLTLDTFGHRIPLPAIQQMIARALKDLEPFEDGVPLKDAEVPPPRTTKEGFDL